MRVLPAHLLAKYPDLNHVAFNGAPIGTGPFRFVSWQRGDRIVLQANPAYFRGTPGLKQLTLAIIPDDNTVEAQLKSGEAELAIEIPAAVYRDVDGAPGSASPTRGFADLYGDHVQYAASAPRRRARPAGARAGSRSRGHRTRRHLWNGHACDGRPRAVLLGVRFDAASDALRSGARQGTARCGRLAPRTRRRARSQWNAAVAADGVRTRQSDRAHDHRASAADVSRDRRRHAAQGLRLRDALRSGAKRRHPQRRQVRPCDVFLGLRFGPRRLVAVDVRV